MVQILLFLTLSPVSHALPACTAESLRVLGMGKRGGPWGGRGGGEGEVGDGPEKADRLLGQMTPQVLRPHGLSSATYLRALT